MTATNLAFIPFHELDGRPNVVVDGPATEGTTLCLSHWPGSPDLPPDLRDDLSAQIAFRYVTGGAHLHGAARHVANNHVDQDGLVGLLALSDTEAALERRAVLEDLAAAGDFGTYRFRAAARASMVVSACTEDERSPFGPLPESFPERTAHLYRELLPRIVEIVDHPERWRELWAEEDALLTSTEEALASGAITIAEHPEVDLAVVTVRAPRGLWGHRFGGRRLVGVHPMAVHNATDRSTLVLVLPDGRLTALHRYETWVMYRSRPRPPRVAWDGLAEQLTATDDVEWAADPVDELTPGLAPVDGSGSGLDREVFVDAVIRHLRSAPPAFDALAGGLLETPAADRPAAQPKRNT